MQRIPDINAPPLNLAANPNSLRPYYSQLPNVTSIANFQSTGAQSYSALEAILERRMAKGLAFNVNYTWSHNLDNSPSFGGNCTNTGYGAIPSMVSKLDWGNACLDMRQRFAATGDYALPFGKNMHGIGSLFLNGWQANVLQYGEQASLSQSPTAST